MTPVRLSQIGLGYPSGPTGRVDGLPDIPLLARAALGAQHELVPVRVFESRGDVPQIVAGAGPLHIEPRPFDVIRVLVLVNVNHRVGAEVDRVGAGGVTAVIFRGIEHLGCQGFPAAGRTAIEESRQPAPKQWYFFSR